MPRMDKLSTYHTNVICTNGRVSVAYVKTVIVDATPETITLDAGGWHTVTTKRKMNQAANQFGLGYAVYQRKGDWFVRTRDGEFPFKDGMRIDRGSGRAYEPLAA